MENSSSNPHAVMVSSPGMGHLIPVLELAKRLESLHSFKVTILFITQTQLQLTSTSTPNLYHSDDVDLLRIPAADISTIIDPNAHVATKICVLMRETIPAIRAAISRLNKPDPSVLIFDMFATEYISMARDFALPSFVYLPSSAWFVALTIHCPVLHNEIRGEYVDQTGFLEIPGCKPVRPDEVVDPMLDRTDAQYTEYLRIGGEIPLFDGVICNTCQDLEASTLAALKNICPVPVYDVGPLVSTHVDDVANEVATWLDRQPARSVIYVSFGSGGTLSVEQMAELAWGLELSQQRFVWVVRAPSDHGEASGSYFGQKGELNDDMAKYLPHGFVERARDLGLLVPQWGPQLRILSHSSIGCFLTHCGWNSIIESLTKGIPMIAWPLYAEQKMNATMIVEELKVAIRTSELPAKKVVERKEIEKMVRIMMEGEEGRCFRLKAEDLQRTVAQALGHGGSSYNCLAKFVRTLDVKN